MGFSDSLDISLSGITANRVHMEIISSNLANINTTRTVQGGPYRRKIPIFKEKPIEFSDALRNAQAAAGGIEVADVVEDQTALQKVYSPGNPDADSDGFVAMPNVSMATEMVDMVRVEKYYEANIAAYNVTRSMIQQTLQIQ